MRRREFIAALGGAAHGRCGAGAAAGAAGDRVPRRHIARQIRFL